VTQHSGEFLELQAALAGEYSLQRELGRGGMGIVYLARDVQLDRDVAIKTLPPHLARTSDSRERFVREARTAAGLSHPHIVPIHRVGAAGGFVFFVMSYVEGETLGERLRTRGPLPPADAARVLREVAWALAYAHGRGIVHRDIKPDNILLEAGTGLQQDVVRLDVPMDDAAAVRVRERPGDFAQHARGIGRWERAARAESLSERLALHVAHDEEDEAARRSDAVDGDDVRVRESRGRARLAHEAFARVGRAREVGWQGLDGDVAVQLHVAREVHDAHPPAAELALERVLSGEGRLKLEEFAGVLCHAGTTTQGQCRFALADYAVHGAWVRN